MNDFLLVFVIGLFASFLTYLGAPMAERFDVPQKVVSAALQFAAGIISALVAFSLMPPAVRYGPYTWIVLSFFIGGALFVLMEYASARLLAARPKTGNGPTSLGLYIGILVDLVIDGVVIGVGATLTPKTGLLLALGLAISTAPLAFVTTATAKQQGVSKQSRRILAILFFLSVLMGAMVGYLVLRNQAMELRLTLIALASGFLITTVTQSLIPEANKEGEPGFAGILFVAGVSLYAFMSLTLA
jgi:ZIP family zinc transporter